MRIDITKSPEGALEYTIEARELSTAQTRGAARDGGPRTANVVALDVADAVAQFVRASDGILVSLDTRERGESIATVRRDDALLLLRVYAS